MNDDDGSISDVLVRIRWSDIDVLDHVNNVHYADYAEQARAQWAGSFRAGSFTIEYLSPTPYSRAPLTVRSHVVDNSLVQEVLSGDRPQARMTLRPTGSTIAGQDGPSTTRTVEIAARPSDLDIDGRLRTGAWLEYLQESRIALFTGDDGLRAIGPIVIARTDVDIAEDPLPDTRAVKIASHVCRVGSSSATIESWVTANGHVVARAQTVLVGFDRDAQRARPWTPQEREQF